jgi:hypothetical protein
MPTTLNEEYEKDFRPRTTLTNRDFNDAFKKVDGTDCTIAAGPKKYAEQNFHSRILFTGPLTRCRQPRPAASRP